MSVSSFACGDPHPKLGETAACVRQRHHPGDHRSQHDDHLVTWPDPPYVPPADPPTALRPRVVDVTPLCLDEDAETVTLEAAGAPLTPLAWVAVVAFVTAWPGVLILLYRVALAR